MSPALNGSSAIQRFEYGNAIKIRDGKTFDFYMGLPHVINPCIVCSTHGLIAQHTCSKVTQLSTSHIGISGGPEVITDSSPYTVQTHLHTTSVWCCPTNQPDVTNTASWSVRET